MPKILINQASVYYELHGKGDPLVLIAGYTCDHRFWHPLIERLSESYQVLVYDNRGVGQTTDDGKPFTISVLANDLTALLAQLDIKKPYLVGHSMGGQIAQVVASTISLRKLAILNSALNCPLAPLMAFQAFLDMRKQALPFDLIFNVSVPWFYGKAFLSETQNLELLKEEFLKDPFPQSTLDQERQLNALTQFDGSLACKTIAVPTLITYASEDLVFPPQEAEKLFSLITHADLKKIDCGHAGISEIPDSIASLLLNFL